MSELLENKMKKDAEKLYEKYRPQMEALEKSTLSKVRGGKLEVGGYYSLGKQLEQYDA